jgi:hypothetical protein
MGLEYAYEYECDRGILTIEPDACFQEAVTGGRDTGIFDGIAKGDTTGAPLGICVGAVVGALNGISDGSTDGNAVACKCGTCDGEGNGCWLGRALTDRPLELNPGR